MPIICWLWKRLACRHSAPTWRGQQLKHSVETESFIHTYTYLYVCHLFIQISVSCCSVVVLRVYKCRYTAITSYTNDFLPASQHVCLRYCPSAVRSHIPHFWESKHQPGFFITVNNSFIFYSTSWYFPSTAHSCSLMDTARVINSGLINDSLLHSSGWWGWLQWLMGYFVRAWALWRSSGCTLLPVYSCVCMIDR